jgi:MinD-like ATPase involved in chromosome partitioning or flagellar assembly
MSDVFVVLGAARAHSTWFRDMSRWSTSAALPVEFVKCVSLDEVRARLGSGRAFSALMVEGTMPGFDRDLTDSAHRAGCAVVAIGAGPGGDRARHLGADVVLPEPATRNRVLAALHEHARPVTDTTDEVDLGAPPPASDAPTGRLVGVIGGGGVGRSTLAMATAQGLARTYDGSVLLADLARRADLALLHDAHDVVPGVQELAEACRTAHLDHVAARDHTYWCADRAHHLLLGLRRPRDWTALRPRSLAAAIDSLRRAFDVTVTDLDADLEGEDECGSVDVEERNALARAATVRADLLVVVGLPTVAGLHRMTRIVDELVGFGVDPARVLSIVNHAPRNPLTRSEIARALAASSTALRGAPLPLASPMFVPFRRNIEDAHRDATPYPASFVEPLGRAVAAVLDRVERPAPGEPVRVRSISGR